MIIQMPDGSFRLMIDNKHIADYNTESEALLADVEYRRQSITANYEDRVRNAAMAVIESIAEVEKRCADSGNYNKFIDTIRHCSTNSCHIV